MWQNKTLTRTASALVASMETANRRAGCARRGFRLALQVGLQLDLHVAPQGIRDGAELLGLPGGVLEFVLTDTGHRTSHVEVYVRDLELLVVQRTHRIHLDPLRLCVVLSQDVGERHRVARRVGGGYELLGTGLTVGTLDPRGKGHRGIVQYPTTLREIP